MAKQQEFQIKMNDGTTQTVKGLVINDRWGIDKREELSSFFLTHIPTGMLITNANTQKALKELVNRSDMIEEDDPIKISKAVASFWDERGWRG